MRGKDIANIGDVYGTMLNSIKKNIHESIKKGGNDLNDGAPLIDGGPSKKGGYHDALDDDKACYDEDEESKHQNSISKIKEKLKDPKLSDKTRKELKQQLAKMSDESEEIKESRKIANEILNNRMSKKISLFDKMYAKVINESWGMEDAEDDIDALSLGDATPDSDLEDDFGGEDDMGDDTVTFTLDKATAQTLIDVLQGALGGGEEDAFGDEGDDSLDFGDEGDDEFGSEEDAEEDEDDNVYDEDEETYGTKTNAPDKKKAFQSKNNKVGGKVKPKSGKASSDVTDDVGDDGDYGHALHGAKQPDMGKNNKVSNLKQGQEFFK